MRTVVVQSYEGMEKGDPLKNTNNPSTNNPDNNNNLEMKKININSNGKEEAKELVSPKSAARSESFQVSFHRTKYDRNYYSNKTEPFEDDPR